MRPSSELWGWLTLRTVTVLVGGMVIVALVVVRSRSHADPVIAEVENLGDTLVFHPVVEFRELILTVTHQR